MSFLLFKTSTKAAFAAQSEPMSETAKSSEWPHFLHAMILIREATIKCPGITLQEIAAEIAACLSLQPTKAVRVAVERVLFRLAAPERGLVLIERNEGKKTYKPSRFLTNKKDGIARSATHDFMYCHLMNELHKASE